MEKKKIHKKLPSRNSVIKEKSIEVIVQEYLDRIPTGENTVDIAKSLGCDYTTIYRAIMADKALQEKYALSKEKHMATKLDEILQYISLWWKVWWACAKAWISQASFLSYLEKYPEYKEMYEMSKQKRLWMIEMAWMKQIMIWNTTLLVKEMMSAYKEDYQETSKIDMNVKTDTEPSEDTIIKIAKMYEMRKKMKEQENTSE